MKKILTFLLLAVLISSCQNSKIRHPEPIRVIYRDLLEDNDSVAIVRYSYYKLDSVRIDTVRKGVPHSLQIPKARRSVLTDRVDLNDIFGSPDDPTDYNYTEIDEEDWEYLNSIGVYWDEDYNCFRKRR